MIAARNGAVHVELSAAEADLLSSVPEWLAEVGTTPDDPAGPRLNQSAYPDDPILSAEYELSHGSEIDEHRTADRETFAGTLHAAVGGVDLSQDQAAAWMRVIGDVRLVFASRLGIEDSRWERSFRRSPELRLLHYLTYLQGALIEALDALMED